MDTDIRDALAGRFTEDDELPDDALDTYVMVPKAGIREHLDPHAAAAEKAGTFADSPWAGLHAELTYLFRGRCRRA